MWRRHHYLNLRTTDVATNDHTRALHPIIDGSNSSTSHTSPRTSLNLETEALFCFVLTSEFGGHAYLQLTEANFRSVMEVDLSPPSQLKAQALGLTVKCSRSGATAISNGMYELADERVGTIWLSTREYERAAASGTSGGLHRAQVGIGRRFVH